MWSAMRYGPRRAGIDCLKGAPKVPEKNPLDLIDLLVHDLHDGSSPHLDETHLSHL
jgi:hypothetical protein